MSDPRCVAGNCLPGSDSPWFLLVLGVVWATAAVLAGLWAVTVRRERRQARRRPRHAPTGRAVVSAVSVQEITQRLGREKAARSRRPLRRIRVTRRVVSPAEGPDARSAGRDE